MADYKTTLEARDKEFLDKAALQANTFPEKEDVLFILERRYGRDAPLNAARALDHCLILRASSRNYGDKNKAGKAVGLPSMGKLFEMVWKLIPAFLQDRIKTWARENKDGTIAREILEYVKQVLGMLPIPVPSILINAVASVVVPPLVTYIINKLAKQSGESTSSKSSKSSVFVGLAAMADEEESGEVTTKEAVSNLKKLDSLSDHTTLRLAGIGDSDMPLHLKKNADSGSEKTSDHATIGQPDHRECLASIEQFYQGDQSNGCKPIPLSLLVAAQIRTNPKSDQKTSDFGNAIWNSLDDKQKKLMKKLGKTSPPPKREISFLLYDPVVKLLGEDPYNVPAPIRPTFAAMKLPEATDWLIEYVKLLDDDEGEEA